MLDAQVNIRYVSLIAAAAAMGGLLFGYDWVVIGGAKPFYERYFGLVTPSSVAWAMSSAVIGCLIGAVVSGALSDRFGRKRLLIASAGMFVSTSVGTALADTFTLFIVWRILGGVAIGLASNLSPMYIAEISPADLRGRLVSSNQLTIVIGILAAQVVNWLVAEQVPAGATDEWIQASWNGQTGWRWMFGLTAVPGIAFFLSMFAVPESPRWLAAKGREEEARRVLCRIRGSRFADAELAEIRASLAAQVQSRGLTELFASDVRSILALGIFIAVLQQWCGINVVFNYAQEVFANAGYQVSDTLFNIVITGVTNLVFTVVALFTVDRLGRRPMMLVGAGGLAVIYLLLGLSYWTGLRGLPVLLLVAMAVAAFACTLGPVTWVVLSEMFPNRIRGAAMGVGVFALWWGCFVLTYTYPYLNRTLGAAGTFWLYSVICAVGFAVMRRKLPETRGLSLEEIERKLTAAEPMKGSAAVV